MPRVQQLNRHCDEQIVVPKPVKVSTTVVHSPISSTNVSAQNFMTNPLLQTNIRRQSTDSNLITGIPRCFSPSIQSNTTTLPNKEEVEHKAGREIQNILFQRSLLDIYAPKAPSSLFELAPTTPSITSEEEKGRFFTTTNPRTPTTPNPHRFTPKLPTTSFNHVESVSYHPMIQITTVDTPTIIRPDVLSPQGGLPYDQAAMFGIVDEDDFEDDYSGDSEYEGEQESEPDEEDYHDDMLFDDYCTVYPSPFGFQHHDSDDECSSARSEDNIYSQSWDYFRSMTPPMRSENPMCSDDRFQYYSSTPTSVGSFRSSSNVGVELGIFNFSPPIH